MSRSTVILAVVAVIGAFIVVSVRSRLTQQQPQTVATQQASNRVIIARHDVSPGSFIQAARDLDWKDVGADVSKDNLLREGNVKLEEFEGAVVRRQLHTGESVPLQTMMKAGEGGFMSAVLEPGMRAVSIAVTATSGNAGFIVPGDRVDLIVTHRVRLAASKDNGGEETVASETFVRDVRVLAVDQMLDNPENKAILAKTVTVEVNTRQAEQVAVATEMGKITITLRSAGSMSAQKNSDELALEELYGTRDSDISQMLGPKNSFSSHVHVIRGDQKENIEFDRGGQ